MRILEEFWYGNIEPTEYDTSSKEYKKLQDCFLNMQTVCENTKPLQIICYSRTALSWVPE